MRIAYVNAKYQQSHTGGGHVHMQQFITNVIALGHEVWAYPGNNHPGVNTIPTDRLNHIKTMRRMDALYLRLENASPVICRWAVPLYRNVYGFPLVTWEFNTLPDELDDQLEGKNPRKPVLTKYSPGCDLAVCVSDALAEIVNQKLHAKKVISISNGSDPQLFKPDVEVVPRLAPFKSFFNVVWIGSIKEAWHDLSMLGEAACAVWQQNEKVAFHILGAGLSGFMADMPPNVFYWGAEYYNRLPNWLAGMQVGLSLYKPGKSLYNSPLKVYDYLSSGLAFISTEHPGVRQIFSQLSQNELMVPFGDSQMLAQTILRLADDRKRTARIGLAGRQLVIEKYNWRRAVRDTLDELEKILKEKGKNSKA